MLSDFIQTKLISNLGFEPTLSQKTLIGELAPFIHQIEREAILVIKGYAGTGKTTMVNALIKTLGELQIKSVLMAPTGRAAKVMNAVTRKTAFTIHKKIYRQKTSSDGFGNFALDRNLHGNTIFIVDEASMIANQSFDQNNFGSGKLLDDLIDYVFEGKHCKLILIGDTAQLPPVKLKISPALDKTYLERYDRPITEIFLSEIVRQRVASGIIHNATIIRHAIDQTQQTESSEPKAFFEETSGKQLGYPKLNSFDFEDVMSITGAELLDELSHSYDKYGLEETMVICRSNKRANRYNEGIRKSILWLENQINIGDILMVVKNNYFWVDKEDKTDFIANGDIVKITRINSYKELYGHKFASVEIELLDKDNSEREVMIMLDTLELESASMSYEAMQTFYRTVEEDYADVGSKKKRFEKIRENPYFNALQVKFAYAVTCHKAQGGQWKSVFIDQGYLLDDMLDVEYYRWLYTAITRSAEKLYLVNFKDDFFKP